MNCLSKIKFSTRTLIVLLCALTFVQLNATVVEIDGVKYTNEGFELPEGEALIQGVNHGTIPAEVIIPKNVTIDGKEYVVTQINREAFYLCDNIISITLPAGLKQIGNYAFSQCTNLTEVKGFPEALDYVGHSVFNNTKWLSSLKDTEPEGLYIAGGWVIGYVGEIPETLTFPANTIGICDYFSQRISYTDQYNVKNIVLNEGLKCICYDAFENFFGLTEIHIPASLEIIEDEAFDGCSGVLKFIVADGNPNFCATDGILYNKDKTKLLLYPNGKEDADVVVNENVKELGDYAFYGANNIKTLTIPEGITDIADQAIRQMNSLETIILPSSITRIGFGTFYNCNIKDIILYAVNPPEYWGVDLSWLENATLYVPEASVDTYKNSDYWNKMKNIESIDLYVGIDEIMIDNPETEAIYNLNGQRIMIPQKGQIYIKGKTKYIQR